MASIDDSVSASSDYVRRCPGCGAENSADVMRCACGSLLFGVDLIRAGGDQQAEPAAVETTSVPAAPEAPICPFDDCAQPNPSGSETCLYCNRPLATAPAPESLLRLPAPLASRYRIERPLHARGAEAELLVVTAVAGGEPAIVKLYRPGIVPESQVRERLGSVAERYRVRVLESGQSEGHAYELMEYCAAGSLRDWLDRRLDRRPASADFHALVGELAGALAAVHAAGLVHRDIKPENVLVRSADPLHLVLCDFGAASALEATQRFTGTARTLPYAPPESLSGVIDCKADYWAMGMILLEATTGRHPFSGLSEAVILHHLTTRSLDLAAVASTNVRKLLRGLLLRDPRQRWGEAEVTRWLANDGALVEPHEAAVEAGFSHPYHLGAAVCTTHEQLALALSRNWREGVADLGNGQLLAWFRDVQKDQNTVRVLLEMQYERNLHPDRQLLKLILHLASGLPPLWRGESIEPHAILARANLALKGDVDAARWLDAIYQHRVLDEHAAAGHAELAEMRRRWISAADRFTSAWDARQKQIRERRRATRDPDVVVLFDQALYGVGDPACPPLINLHPRLLAISYDPRWGERLRQRLRPVLTALEAQCPWLAEWGDPAGMDAADLLVTEALLPEVKKAADQQAQTIARAADEVERRRLAFEGALRSTIAEIGSSARAVSWLGSNADSVHAGLAHYADLLAEIRATGAVSPAWDRLRQTARRYESPARTLRSIAERLMERRAANAGWLSARMIGAQLLALAILPEVFGAGTNGILLALIPAILAWRIVPVMFDARRIRELAGKF